MIARICGKITQRCANHLIIDVGGISYQVFIPTTVMQRLEKIQPEDAAIDLITYHYLQVEPSRSIPILIGFLNEVEREFFEVFITVSGIGPRAALKALNKPISLIAKAIDEADTEFLKSLPGIGQQRAKEIVAKLQNKVGKFGLIQDDAPKGAEIKQQDIIEEVIAVMTQLEYKRSEAMFMVKKAMERCPDIETPEELLNEVYKQRRLK